MAAVTVIYVTISFVSLELDFSECLIFFKSGGNVIIFQVRKKFKGKILKRSLSEG